MEEKFHQIFSKFFSERGYRVEDFLDAIPEDHKNLEIEYLLRLTPFIEELTNAKKLDGRKLCKILIESEIVDGNLAENLDYVIHLQKGWYPFIKGNDFIIHNNTYVLAAMLLMLFYLPYSIFDVDHLFPDPMQKINMKLPSHSSILNLSISETNEINIYDPLPPLGKRTKSLHLDHEHGIELLVTLTCDKERDPFIDIVYVPLLELVMNKICF